MAQMDPLVPPALLDAPDGWQPAGPTDEVAQHAGAAHWPHERPPARWEVARVSASVYVYREVETGWAFVAKYYHAKTGEQAQVYAQQEYDLTCHARQALASGPVRAVQPLGVWRGVLLLEYVPGLTLEDTIAVRRSRPGTLLPALDLTATLLASLHASAAPAGTALGFEAAVAYAQSVVENLATHGVLQHDPIVQRGIDDALQRWAARPGMWDDTPAFTHGDATTTNFIFPTGGGVVAVDWERAKTVDPAADLGRLMAEVVHSVTRYGGTVREAQALADRLCDVYCEAAGLGDASPLRERARFYYATSTLRIARNGWLSRLERTALAARALALLT